MKNILKFLACCFLFVSCKKEKPPELQTSSGVYIINEGNFNFGNGEVTFYDTESQQITNNLFSTVNGFSLGDVVQSMYVKDTLGFLVVNNSRKIEVVKIPSFTKVKTINIPGSSPRYLLPINDSIAYVTDIYANKVHVINFSNGELVTQIAIPQYGEHLLLVDNTVFVEGKRIFSNTNSKGALMRINAENHTYIDRLEFEGDAGGMVRGKGNRVWIAVDENPGLSQTASLKCFDKEFNLVTEYNFSQYGHHPHQLSTNGSGEVMYFIDVDIYSLPIEAPLSGPVKVLQADQRNFYGLGIDPVRNEIYVSDALDYVQSSVIYRYDRNGQLMSTFTAGIISNNFIFTYD